MLLRFIMLSVLAYITMALSGCFSVALTAPDSVEQNAVFTMSATPDKNDGAVSYQWSLDNSVISEDATYHTMLSTLGEHVLTVVATDEKGNEDTKSKTVSVVAQASLNPDFSFSINVSNKAGYALTEAIVTINGSAVVTDQYGLAQFDGISQASLMLVSASKAGYLTQTYQYRFDAMQENAEANLTLQYINPESHVVDSSEAIDIIEAELHAKLIFAANRFVDTEGNAVTGDVEITITPIDIRAVDNAFLGGGQALTAAGEAVALISTGMADYQFSKNSSEVTLAEGASAIIEMDLAVTTGDDGRIFVEGDTIEMWWFDPKKGFWTEEGVGTVQRSGTSETGLKLVATVKHFTTWSWGYYKQGDRSSITFKCFKNGQPLASDESCRITAASTSINREFLASTSGITAINISPNVTYSVTANLTSGDSYWAGNKTLTTVSGTNAVSVNMQSIPTKTGYIQCRIITNSETSIQPCNSVVFGGTQEQQYIDSIDANNFRADFSYLRADLLNISSTLNSGLNQMILVDTSNVNGTLDVEMIFDISFGSLQCSATLDGSDMQYFPCDALVTDSNNVDFPIWADNFSGTPLTADFTYTKDSQQLSIEVASIFDEAILRSSDGGFYISGTGSLVSIDLARETAVALVAYSAHSENVYSFNCIDEGGLDINCDITWYNSMETIIFEGNIDDLPNQDILPTWMSGKMYVDGSVGFGYAHVPSLSLYSSEPIIDTVNRVITFTLVDMPM